MSEVTIFDGWLASDGPAALVLREHLIPVEGADGVVFPATFAGSEDKSFAGGYNLDAWPDGKNVCLIDSVGSQANRIEPIFMTKELAELVPQIVVKAGDKQVNLLEAGHRAGDAIVRCSALQKDLHDAFVACQAGDARPLAKIAPTSLVFGVWDSRDTQAKLPRLIASTIRAFDVRCLTRSAQYVPATEYVDRGLLDEPPDQRTKKAYAERGFVHVPASGAPGGIIAGGGIRRDATLHLAALRQLAAGADDVKSLALRRYVLGLALTAFTWPVVGYLRQGCNIVLDPDRKSELVEVRRDGTRTPVSLTNGAAIVYAKATAKAFGVGDGKEVDFDREKAKADVADGTPDAAKARKSKPKAAK